MNTFDALTTMRRALEAIRDSPADSSPVTLQMMAYVAVGPRTLTAEQYAAEQAHDSSPDTPEDSVS